MGATTKRYLFASDFDQTLTFNDSGYVLSELVGIPPAEFERKSKGMAELNLVQQGAELAYLLLHDPEFHSKVRREHLHQVGKQIRLKENIELLYQILDHGIPGYHFDFYVLSAAPVEVIQSALEGIVPPDHIFGTEFRYHASGEIDTITRATAGYGKVAALDRLHAEQRGDALDRSADRRGNRPAGGGVAVALLVGVRFVDHGQDQIFRIVDWKDPDKARKQLFLCIMSARNFLRRAGLAAHHIAGSRGLRAGPVLNH